jgi:hypothetical protein
MHISALDLQEEVQLQDSTSLLNHSSEHSLTYLGKRGTVRPRSQWVIVNAKSLKSGNHVTLPQLNISEYRTHNSKHWEVCRRLSYFLTGHESWPLPNSLLKPQPHTRLKVQWQRFGTSTWLKQTATFAMHFNYFTSGEIVDQQIQEVSSANKTKKGCCQRLLKPIFSLFNVQRARRQHRFYL